MQKVAIVISIGFVIASCAAQPIVAIHEGQSLSGYTTLEVPAAINETGKTYSFDPAQAFTDDLRSDLKSRGYNVVDSGGPASGTLIIRCSLTKFQEGSPVVAWMGLSEGRASATVKTVLIDKRTGQLLGTMVTPQTRAEGLAGYLTQPERGVISGVARGTAAEIDQRIKGE